MFNLQSIFKEVSLSRFNIYLALWLAVVLNVMFYKQVQLLTPYHGFKAYAFIGATILVVLAFYHLVFQLLQWRPMAKGLAALLIIIGGMSAYFVNSLGVSITPDQIQNMMQTDGNEVRDLLSWRLVLWIGAMVVLPLVVLFKVKIRQSLQALTHSKCHVLQRLTEWPYHNQPLQQTFYCHRLLMLTKHRPDHALQLLPRL